MPIDGSVWLENPLPSSYLPSRVYKIIQTMDNELATIFLRRILEAVFVFNQNIAEEQTLIKIINQMNLDGEEIVKEASLPNGQQLLNEDFALAKRLGVRGFPTIIMVNAENKGVKIVGSRPLQNYVAGLEQFLSSSTKLEAQQQPVLLTLLEKEIRLFSKELK